MPSKLGGIVFAHRGLDAEARPPILPVIFLKSANRRRRRVFDLQPVVGAPWPIGRATALRHNGLATERAGVPVASRPAQCQFARPLRRNVGPIRANAEAEISARRTAWLDWRQGGRAQSDRRRKECNLSSTERLWKTEKTRHPRGARGRQILIIGPGDRQADYHYGGRGVRGAGQAALPAASGAATVRSTTNASTQCPRNRARRRAGRRSRPPCRSAD